MFARWLDVNFAIWCDMQIDGLLRGEGLDHKRLRHEAASSFKVMNAIRKAALEAEGKEPKRHHFINEARLVNYALTGEFSSQDREAMTRSEARRVGKACVSTCRSRWSPYHEKTKTTTKNRTSRYS